MGTVVVLAAQVGGAKLADGLYRLRGMDLAVVVNTGDDYRHLGLAFSPDLDTALFTLAGIASATAGWEPEGETRALRSEEHTSELQSPCNLVCRLLLEKKKHYRVSLHNS